MFLLVLFCAFSCSSPCSPLFLLFLLSQLWGWTNLPPFVATLSLINKSYLVFFIISSTSQFLTVLFAGGSWCKSSRCANISSVQFILYRFFLAILRLSSVAWSALKSYFTTWSKCEEIILCSFKGRDVTVSSILRWHKRLVLIVDMSQFQTLGLQAKVSICQL